MMRRYPAYRDSGEEWLGEVPEGWEVARLKEVCRVFPSNVDKHTLPDEITVALCNYTDVYYNDEITAGLDFMQATARPEEIEKFSLMIGDVIFTKDSETADDIGIAALVTEELPGVVCGYHLSIARPSALVIGGFIKRCFDSRFAKDHFAVSANGLTRVGLGQSAINNLALPLPPLPEQTTIAAFLDRETAKIDALVAEQRRLIALLREKRQAVISHAVTRGLNPNAPLKPSGVEWLGDVPEGWEVVQLRCLVDSRRRVTYGIVQPGLPDPEGRFMVRGQDYSFGWVQPENIFRVSPAVEEPYRRARLQPGDLVMTIVGAGTGKVETVPDFLEGANITQTTARIAPNADLVLGDFLRHVLTSELGKLQVALFQKGAAQPGLNLEYITAFRIPLPPKQEQEEIVAYLNVREAAFSPLIKEAESAITLLQERRAALISAAVTGKIDVRHLAQAEIEAA